MGGKSSGATAGYKYYAGFQMVLARYIHKLYRIRVDQKIAWSGLQSAEGIININMPNLFGAPKSADPEGGVVGDVNFQPGLPTQMPDSYLAAKIGVAIPASRGVSALVGHQIYLGNNPYMKDWDVRAERIHQLDDGSPQWYDVKSAILGISGTGGSYTFDATTAHTTPGYNLSEAHITLAYGETITFQPLGGSASAYSRWSSDAEAYASPPAGSRKPWAYYLYVSKNGEMPTQYYPNEYDTPDEAAAAAAAAGPITISGPSHSGDPSNTFAIYLSDGDGEAYNNRGQSSFTIGEFSFFNMNPAHMLRECLTNGEWGYGYDTADIDDVMFMAAADTLFSEGLGLSYFWDDANTEIDAVIENILAHVDAQLYVDRRTQLWSLVLIRADYDVTTLPEFTDDVEIISMEDFARPGFMDLVNEITVNYYDFGLSQSSTLTLPNSALFLQQGVKIAKQNDYTMCCSSNLASRLCLRDLRTESTPLASGTVYLIPTYETNALHRGSVCKLTFHKYSLYSTIVRVTAISFGDGSSKRIKMSFTEDVFTLPDAVVTQPPQGGWVDPGNTPTPILNRMVTEVPYAYLLKAKSQTDLDALLAASPELGYIAAAAARPGNALSALLYVDSGAGYQTNAGADFCAFGKLTANIGFLDATLTIDTTSDIDEAAVGTYFQIDNEIMSFTSIAAGVLTGVTRGLFDTVPTKHLLGAGVFFIENHLDSDAIEYSQGESVNIKIVPVTKTGTLALGDALVDTVALAVRAISPYPPGNVQIGGAAYPATVSGSFVVTWAHRNRVTQATQFVDTTMGDVTPEINTRYGLRFLDATSTLLIEQTNIGLGTATVVLNYTGNVTMQLYSITDNGRSVQQHEFAFAYTPPGGTVVTAITATAYTAVDDTTIIDGGTI